MVSQRCVAVDVHPPFFPRSFAPFQHGGRPFRYCPATFLGLTPSSLPRSAHNEKLQTGPPDLSLDGFQSYHAQPSSIAPSSSYAPLPERHRGATSTSTSKKRAKTRFPSLTPSTLAPAPGNFSASGDTQAAEAVAHARKTWAPPALRTQAIASYGAVPDLEVSERGGFRCGGVSRRLRRGREGGGYGDGHVLLLLSG